MKGKGGKILLEEESRIGLTHFLPSEDPLGTLVDAAFMQLVEPPQGIHIY